MIDSIYFAVVTFTTIGYGDVVPANYTERAFTIVYALSGVACLGIAIGILGTNVVEAQEKAVNKTKELAKTRVMTFFAPPHVQQDLEQAMGEKLQAEAEHGSVSRMRQLMQTFVLVLVILAAFAACVANDPGIDNDKYDIVDALYFAIITATTVGYGDFSPKSQQGRLMAIFFIPLAV